MAINGLGGDKTLAQDKCFAIDVYCSHRERHYQQDRGDYLKFYGSEYNRDSCLEEANPCLTNKDLWCRGRRLEHPTAKLNDDWLRSDSMIAVIMVTDEDNSEIPKDKEGRIQRQVDLNTDELISYLEGTLNRTKGVDYEIFGILNPLASESYNKIIAEDNRQSIEDDDYKAVIENISAGIIKVLDKSLDISDIASKADFKFKSITGKQQGVHYTLEGNIITFKDEYIPAKGDKISVNYSSTE